MGDGENGDGGGGDQPGGCKPERRRGADRAAPAQLALRWDAIDLTADAQPGDCLCFVAATDACRLESKTVTNDRSSVICIVHRRHGCLG